MWLGMESGGFIMWRTVKWVLGVTGVGLILSLAVGGLYFWGEMSSLNDTPDNIIRAMPASYTDKSGKPQRAYSGQHPRLAHRPDETFQFPIGAGQVGPATPLFAGENTYPFWCGSNKITGSQPLVDNHDGVGIPVFAEDEEGERLTDIVGYSKDCLHPTAVTYFYLSAEDNRFHELDVDEEPNPAIETIEIGGVDREFVVRVETGTINRHFYAIAVLRGEGESLGQPRGNLWNGRLIYQFRGGVGIGRRQGNIKEGDILKRRKNQLQQGYAVVYSSANQTSNHYNMWLAEDTALRLKKQFTSLYGDPIYTVGIGGSGGAIQQYLLAQNSPGLLDGIIPLYSYPDMVTQTIYVMDCEPLEYFFDVQDSHNPRWVDWSQRVQIEGLSSADTGINYFQAMASMASVLQGNIGDLNPDLRGSSECVQSWRGLTPLINNPNFVHFSRNFSPEVNSQTHWTHWEDLYQFYGRDQRGFAQSTWDNVGVQYGLKALQEQRISVEEFLRINASVGGWKPAEKLKPERYWFLQGQWFPVQLSIWSHQNLSLPANAEQPAPRTEASLDAIEGIFRSGHVFLGQLQIPILDVRHYLDRDLDMHHASASFMTRARMLKSQGSADNQVIWISNAKYNPVEHAFAVMDEWLINLRMYPDRGVVKNRPEFAIDSCFDEEGLVIARGSDVWDGEWNQRPNGVCMEVYPSFPTSREIAGAPVSGDIFKCELQPVNQAIARGLYGGVDMNPYREQLNTIFPQGVCDYSRPGLGEPANLLKPAIVAETELPPKSDAPATKAERLDKDPQPVEDAQQVKQGTVTLSKFDNQESTLR